MVQDEIATHIEIEFLEGLKVFEALQLTSGFTMGKGCTS